MSTIRPYYHRRKFAPTLGEEDFASDGRYVDLAPIPIPEFDSTPDPVARAEASYDDRAAAVISAAAGLGDVNVVIGKSWPKLRYWTSITWTGIGPFATPSEPWFHDYDLCEFKWTKPRGGVRLMRGAKCLSVMAYLDFFPNSSYGNLRSFVSSVIPYASPGYCGSFGAGVGGTFDLLDNPSEGNYDMNQMHLIPMAYAYFDDLDSVGRERLITVLLARGRIHRPNRPELLTSGSLPNDWSRAGFISPLGAHKDIGETENHILMMLTTRYLTNQLLFQRDRQLKHDNRRNGSDDVPSCFSLVLSLLRNILRDDFSEYNAKGYQEETRWALLNLCSYAYDHEVRLAARMALDYVSAHMAVSSNDLRRMLPFRRRNEGDKVARGSDGIMKVSLIGHSGADPLAPYFALQAGNTRSCVVLTETSIPLGIGGQTVSSTPWSTWGMEGSHQELSLELLGEYRLPPLLLDLFVNDAHRRFFQRLHRRPRNETGGHRNVDNMEIYAGSPSYLITAGGSAATYAIDPHFAGIVMGDQSQQLGVAVTTSFIPTTTFGGKRTLVDRATQVIQLGSFSQVPPGFPNPGCSLNYGVAPDFACGHQIFLPNWTGIPKGASGFRFVDQRSVSTGTGRSPGFFLAVLQDDGMAVLEALDTWLHPEVSWEQFQAGVLARNGGLTLASGATKKYVTTNGSSIEFVIWGAWERGDAMFGAEVLSVTYGSDAADAMGDAASTPNHFLNGTIMNSGPEAVIQIRNPFLGTRIRLDMSDKWHPRRTDEHGAVESAGSGEEVWADFDWTGAEEGDCCRPFATLAAASNAVRAHGTIRMIPSESSERVPIGVSKRFRMVAPIGGVKIGV
ncbi:MAG: hypothetical protein DMD35_10015 [Gemmatimonadetes bacterium]|nr:MAG: hypothetical protein DMD35_10015 [Gemmatimonadota bacterium]